MFAYANESHGEICIYTMLVDGRLFIDKIRSRVINHGNSGIYPVTLSVCVMFCYLILYSSTVQEKQHKEI